METLEYLLNKNVDLRSIIASVEESVGLNSADVLLSVGSLAEGLGNSKSDLDLLLITARDTNRLSSLDVVMVVNKCLLDIQILPARKLEEVLTRFAAWVGQPYDITRLANIPLDDRRLLHRLLHGSIIFEQCQSLLPALTPIKPELARLKLQIARHMARTIQIDMVGCLEAHDYSSLTFAAQELLGHAVDALAAGHNLTNPIPKWRSRILERVPANWERALVRHPAGLAASDLFWVLHRAPELPRRNDALQHALRIATFARAAFNFAERRLLRRIDESRQSVTWPHVERKMDDLPLPYLGLDVDYLECDGRISIGRLNEFDHPLELSPREFEIVLLFDGITTEREAEIAVCGTFSVTREDRLVDRTISRVAEAGLSTGYRAASTSSEDLWLPVRANV